MSVLGKLTARIGALVRGGGPRVWYHPAYRLPLAGIETTSRIEPRRADLVAWFLVERGFLARRNLRAPVEAAWADLARVHTPDLLESLGRPDTLARIFATDDADLPVDQLLRTIRLACGGTIEAARVALQRNEATVNLLGGFHHAGPGRAGGFCPVNDVAIALARVREDGFAGRVAVLDVDAHPADGTAACLAGDRDAWVGSIDGEAPGWDVPDAVVRIVLAPGTGDDPYLEAVDQLIERMGRADLVFVVAGGDVLAGDRLGRLGLTLDGARRRDARIAEALADVPSVWLPGGGYHADAWRVLAGTCLVLAGRAGEAIPQDVDPLEAHFARIAHGIAPADLAGADLAGEQDDGLSPDDIARDLHMPSSGPLRLLGYYTAQGVEYAFYVYGLLEFVRRLGYSNLRVLIDRATAGDRMRLLGDADGREHLLVEAVLELRTVAPARARMLYVHWMTLRHPLGRFSQTRPPLPGQDAPGLGLAREATQMLARMAERLDAEGIALRPAWHHIAFASARTGFRFLDPARHGRFEALVRDLSQVTLLEATLAIAAGRVRLNGAPYAWEADEMALRRDAAPSEEALLIARDECARCTFTLVEEGKPG